MARRLKTEIENLESLKAGDGVQIGDTKYDYGADLSTEGTPVIDPGLGKAVSIRVFEFKANPGVNTLTIDKQALFNSHAKQIATILWGDGWRPLEEVPPRVIIDSSGYKIFVPCEARIGTTIIEKPKNLSEELTKSNKNKRKLDNPNA